MAKPNKFQQYLLTNSQLIYNSCFLPYLTKQLIWPIEASGASDPWQLQKMN
jgi:hypothetical protein